MTHSRKRRASSELQMETVITDLPDEILVNIFKYLKKSDLLSLTLQCKRFEEIVCNGFMDRLILYISSKNLKNDWIGSRKYTYVLFARCYTNDNILDFLNILLSIGDSIKKLCMHNLTINPITMRLILKICHNLKFLDLPKLDLSLPDEAYVRNLPLLDLEELTCFSDRGFSLKLLQGTSCRRFSFHNIPINCQNLLENFLKSQKNLEHLDISSFHPFELFNTDTLNHVDFRLKSLDMSQINTRNSQNFHKFINNHADTLSQVKLHTCNSISILNAFRNVKQIKSLTFHTFSSPETVDYDVRENVEELDITVSTTDDLAVKFPNLKKINIELIEPDYFSSMETLKLGKFDKLTHLRLCGECTIHDLTISASTKFICVENYTFAKMPHFEHFQFEEIKLINCENVDWLAEFLAKDETRVNELTIKSMDLSSEVFKVIVKHGSKITNLISKDIKFL